ncbi:MAG: hypothetical protein AAF938_19785 [Myxococcota bacterium]
MRSLISATLLLSLAFGCAAESGGSDINLSQDPVLQSEIRAGKQDGAFGSREITLGDDVSGSLTRDSLGLFALELTAGDEIAVNIYRTSGNLNPSAYLYEGTEDFLRPDHFNADTERVALSFNIRETGQHHIAVQAYRGRGEGDYFLETRCLSGPCAGQSTLQGIDRANECVMRATDCAFRRLPEFGGRVGAATAERVFDECLREEGEDCFCVEDENIDLGECKAACDYAEVDDVCGRIVDSLPAFADQELACLEEMTACLDDCSGTGFADGDTLEELEAGSCWNGNGSDCVQYTNGHASCGGTEYSAGSMGACVARCEAAEGAFDEGPFDLCVDVCADIGSQAVANFYNNIFVPVFEDDEGLNIRNESDMPLVIRRSAEQVIRDHNEEAESIGSSDRVFLADSYLEIVVDGEVIGYVVDLWYDIDDPLFDGGGIQVFMNLIGDVIAEDSWFA